MELSGSLANNLRNAIASCARYQGRQVYRETMLHWRGIAHEARRSAIADPKVKFAIDALVTQLEIALIEYE